MFKDFYFSLRISLLCYVNTYDTFLYSYYVILDFSSVTLTLYHLELSSLGLVDISDQDLHSVTERNKSFCFKKVICW